MVYGVWCVVYGVLYCTIRGLHPHGGPASGAFHPAYPACVPRHVCPGMYALAAPYHFCGRGILPRGLIRPAWAPPSVGPADMCNTRRMIPGGGCSRTARPGQDPAFPGARRHASRRIRADSPDCVLYPASGAFLGCHLCGAYGPTRNSASGPLPIARIRAVSTHVRADPSRQAQIYRYLYSFFRFSWKLYFLNQ